MPSQADRQLGQLAVKLGLVSVAQVNECLRIQAAQEEVGETTSLDRVLFDQGLLSGPNVYQIQSQLRLRIAFCPHCDTKYNLFSAKPGSVVQCKKCGGRIPVPGHDAANPFLAPAVAGGAPRQGAVVEAKRARAAGASNAAGEPAPAGKPAKSGAATFVIAALLWVGVGALLVESTVSAYRSDSLLKLPSAVAAGAFLLVSIPVRRGGQFFTAAGLGLAGYTGLVAWTALTQKPGSGVYTTFGLDACRLLTPLILVYIGLVFAAGAAFLRVTPTWLAWIPFPPAIYGFMFFVLRLFPVVGEREYLYGPEFLKSMPWFAHPGVVTLVFFFPLAAAVLLVASLLRAVFGRPRTLFRSLGVILGLLVLSAFGIAIGRTRGEIELGRIPKVGDRIEVQVDRGLERIPVSGHWKPSPSAPEESPKEGTPGPETGSGSGS